MNETLELILPLEKFLQHVYEKPDAIFLRQPHAGLWRCWSWRQAHHEVVRIAQYLQKFPRGSHIAIYSYNCAHWLLADLAIWLAGHVSVPIYPSAGAETLQQILRHADCVAAFVGKLPDFQEKCSAVPESVECIAIHQMHEQLVSWDELVARELPLINPVPRAAQELATIIYTSGTTGQPKGVMISFAAIASAGINATRWIGARDDERFFSYLPLAHVAERLVIETGSLYCGGTISFAESLETFADNLRGAAPTVFLGVPRIWLKFQQALLQRLPANRLNQWLRWPLVSTVVRKLIRRALGMHRVRHALSGAAPLPAELMQWYEALGITICEGYAMTENFGYSHFSYPGRTRPGYVGECLPEADIRLAEDGEILMRSPSLMMGYYRDPELTAEVLQDGWLCSGDLGEIDESGRLRITGRKKDLFKTSKGKYVAPGPIETALEARSGLSPLVVMGAGLPQPVALAVIGEKQQLQEQLAQWEQALVQINATLDAHEKLDALLLTTQNWTTDNGLLTPSLKPRRFQIEQRYCSAIERALPQRGERSVMLIEADTETGVPA